MKPESFDVQPMSPVESLLPGNLLWLWITLAILLVVAIVIYLIRRNSDKPNRILPEPLAYKAFLASIDSQLPSPDHPREHATALSLELRRYLTSAFADPLLFETNEERKQAFPSRAQLPEALRARIDQHLDTLAVMQYRKNPTAASGDLVHDTLDLANRVHQAFAPLHA